MIQKIPGSVRVETGALQIGNDWPGVFIRGDEVGGIIMLLRALAEDAAPGMKMEAERVIKLLNSCTVDQAEHLKEWRKERAA